MSEDGASLKINLLLLFPDNNPTKNLEASAVEFLRPKDSSRKCDKTFRAALRGL
jgi:hypothetical protein